MFDSLRLQDGRRSRIGVWITLAMAGCTAGEEIGASRQGDVASAQQTDPSSSAPTWHEHIAPIVRDKCTACHKNNGIAPFSLETYERARPFAAAMVDAVERGAMPPFLAQETAECTPRNRFAGDVRLSAHEKQLLRAWSGARAPEGDPTKAVPLEPARSLDLEREDAVMRLPEPIPVDLDAHGDIHTCVIIDPELTQDVYVTGRQITPGNTKILHHVVAYTLRPQKTDGTRLTRAQMVEALKVTKGVEVGGRYDCFGGLGLEDTGLATELLHAWAPGAMPATSPRDSGQPMRKDSLVVLDIHYHPLPTHEEDRDTKFSLMFADARPAYIARPILLGNVRERQETAEGIGELLKQPGEAVAEFEIPAGATDHVEEMTWTWKLPNLPNGIRVYAAGTHMHYVGRNMRVTLENTTPRPGEPASECLIETPQWDFNWQNGYGYDAPYEALPFIHPGDVLRLRCVYDNSRKNRFLARALDARGLRDPIDVNYGEDTLDEMCVVGIGAIFPNSAP